MTLTAIINSLVLAASSLVGVIIGGIIAYSVNNRSLKHQELLTKRDFRTKKLEELHGRLIDLETYGRHTYTCVRTAFFSGEYESTEVRHGLPEIEFLIRTLFPSKPDLFDHLYDVTMNRFGHLIGIAIVDGKNLSPSEKKTKTEEADICLSDLTKEVAAVKAVIYKNMQEMVGS